jgi:hypothetical protein
LLDGYYFCMSFEDRCQTGFCGREERLTQRQGVGRESRRRGLLSQRARRFGREEARCRWPT